MPELRKVVRKGQTVWAEVGPDRCGCGDPGPFRPGWGQCPEQTCRQMGRTWTCDCGARMFDVDHVHQDGPVPPSMQRCG